MRSLYIARPIDLAGGHEVTGKIARVVRTVKNEVIAKSGVLAYDPGAAFTVGSLRSVSYELQEINQKAIHCSDSMLAYAPAGVKSWGVPAEVELAHNRGMNVAIVTDTDPTWAMPWGPNVTVVRTKPHEGGSEGWLDATIRALDWLAEAKPPRFTTKGRNASERTSITFAPVEGKTAEDVRLPVRAYSDDAGLDLYTAQDMWIPAGGFVDVPTHLRVQLPAWSWGFLVGRSSTLRKKGLMVNPGIIDTGYRGELFVGVQNLGERPIHVEAGDRLAQLIVMGNATRRVNPVMEDELEPHARGNNGFGSSGN